MIFTLHVDTQEYQTGDGIQFKTGIEHIPHIAVTYILLSKRFSLFHKISQFCDSFYIRYFLSMDSISETGKTFPFLMQIITFYGSPQGLIVQCIDFNTVKFY